MLHLSPIGAMRSVNFIHSFARRNIVLVGCSSSSSGKMSGHHKKLPLTLGSARLYQSRVETAVAAGR